MTDPEDFEYSLMQAFWDTPGATRAGVMAACRLVAETCAKAADDLCDESPSGSYDNGGTQDGWRMACTKLAEKYRAMFTVKAAIGVVITVSCLAAAAWADASPQPPMQVASSMEAGS